VSARLGDFVEPFGTLLQHDLKSGARTVANLGHGRQAGEGVFVPAGATGAEDEGWVLSVVYNALDDSSSLVILDATNFGGDPVATIALPQRVPFGFHGIWEPASE
jgi:carotenoid cleavage dioxygenase